MPGYIGTTAALTTAQAQQNNSWYQVQTLSTLLGRMKFAQFSIQTVRTEFLEALQNMISLTPYAIGLDNQQDSSTNIRFPLSILYINGGISPYNSYLQSLASALSFKERVQEKTMLGNAAAPSSIQSTSTPSTMPTLSNYNDASQLFYNTVTAMQNAINQSLLVFSQPSFEQYYELTWSTTFYYMDRSGRYGLVADDITVWEPTKAPKAQPSATVALPRSTNDELAARFLEMLTLNQQPTLGYDTPVKSSWTSYGNDWFLSNKDPHNKWAVPGPEKASADRSSSDRVSPQDRARWHEIVDDALRRGVRPPGFDERAQFKRRRDSHAPRSSNAVETFQNLDGTHVIVPDDLLDGDGHKDSDCIDVAAPSPISNTKTT
jgi:hypothetical protein